MIKTENNISENKPYGSELIENYKSMIPQGSYKETVQDESYDTISKANKTGESLFKNKTQTQMGNANNETINIENTEEKPIENKNIPTTEGDHQEIKTEEKPEEKKDIQQTETKTNENKADENKPQEEKKEEAKVEDKPAEQQQPQEEKPKKKKKKHRKTPEGDVESDTDHGFEEEGEVPDENAEGKVEGEAAQEIPPE